MYFQHNTDSHNRVHINNSENISQNYINASYINGPLNNDKNMFIATQGPLQHTIQRFWELIITQKIKLIIMLAQLSENGRVYNNK